MSCDLESLYPFSELGFGEFGFDELGLGSSDLTGWDLASSQIPVWFCVFFGDFPYMYLFCDSFSTLRMNAYMPSILALFYLCGQPHCNL